MRYTVDGLNLHVRESGAGLPVLLLHGFPLSSDMWRETMDRAGESWRMIAPDLRGHGASEVTDDASMPRLARDQVELLDLLGIAEPVVVVGLSMGGYVALEMGRRYPERVRALALVDTRAEADSPDAAETRRTTAERVLREGSGGLADAMAGKMFSPSTPDALRSLWRERMAATPPAGVAAALHGMADRSDSRDVLSEWRKPLLVVVGEDDQITPPEMARGMHHTVSGSRLEVIPRAGHLPPVEQPDDFGRILDKFLKDLPVRV
ncbi:alpha/beta fold hydrolase [soil metagenome]